MNNMKNLKYLVLLVVAISFLSSCKKDDPEEVSIVLSTNQDSYSVGEVLTFVVVTNDGEDVTSESEVRLNDEVITNNYELTSIGNFVVSATYKETSSQINISVQGEPFSLEIDDVEVEASTQATAYEKTYHVVGADGELGFHLTNNKDEAIKLRMTIVDVLDGANGADMQICFATCSAEVNLGDTEVKTLAAGHVTTTAETHVFNGQAGNRDFSCTIKINQVDDNDEDVPDGKEVYFKYSYIAQ